MPNTIFTSIGWAQTFIQYSPLTAGTGFEPAVTIASMIRNSVLDAPMTWNFNRFEDTSTMTDLTHQDYIIPLTNFGFLETVSLTDSTGNTQQLKDVLNTTTLAPNSVQQRPSSVCVLTNAPGVNIKIRFNATPDKVYKITLTYQGLSTPFGPFVINSSAGASGGNTTYNGIFAPLSFTPGSIATVSGFSTSNGTSPISSVANAAGPYTTYTGVFNTAFFPAGTQVTIGGFVNRGNNGIFTVVSINPTTLVVVNSAGIAETATALAIGAVLSPNNGTFLVVSSTPTQLVLANPLGVIETPPTGAATAINSSWAPLIDSFSDVYNNLFLSECFQAVGEDAEAARYRQRGVAALLAKASGLTETQINAFRQVWLARDSEAQASQLRTTQGVQARGI